MGTQNLWAALITQPFPVLHELNPMDRDRFVLFDAYLRDCVEEWFVTGFQPIQILHCTANCSRTITKRWHRCLTEKGNPPLDSGGDWHDRFYAELIWIRPFAELNKNWTRISTQSTF